MSKANKSVNGAGARSVEDFRANFDRNYIVPNKIRAALAELGDGWVYEAELLKLAGISTTDLAIFREQFSDYWLVADRAAKKRVWCGTSALAEELRNLIG